MVIQPCFRPVPVPAVQTHPRIRRLRVPVLYVLFQVLLGVKPGVTPPKTAARFPPDWQLVGGPPMILHSSRRFKELLATGKAALDPGTRIKAQTLHSCLEIFHRPAGMCGCHVLLSAVRGLKAPCAAAGAANETTGWGFPVRV